MEFTARTRTEALAVIRQTRPAWLRARGLTDGDPDARIDPAAVLDEAGASLAAAGTGIAAGRLPGLRPADHDWFRVKALPGGRYTVDAPSTRVSYSREPLMFEDACGDARQRRAAGDSPVPFRRGPSGSPAAARWFSVGIGFAMTNPPVRAQEETRQIARFLSEAGITARPPHRDQEAAARAGGLLPWKYGYSRRRGEWFLASPRLHDEPGTWEQLDRACAVLRQYGAVVTPSNATRILVSADGTEGGTIAGGRLQATVEGYGDVLARLAQDPAGRDYGHRDGTPGVRLFSLPDRYAEFGLWRTCLHPGVIQAQARISLALVDAAARGGYEPPPGTEVTGSHLLANPERRPLTWEERKAETRSVRNLCDLLFGDDQAAAKQAAALFEATCWHPGRLMAGTRPARTPPGAAPAGQRDLPEDRYLYHRAQAGAWAGEAFRLRAAGDSDGYRHALLEEVGGHSLHQSRYEAMLPAGKRAQYRQFLGTHGQGPDGDWIPVRWRAPAPAGPVPDPGPGPRPGRPAAARHLRTVPPGPPASRPARENRHGSRTRDTQHDPALRPGDENSLEP